MFQNSAHCLSEYDTRMSNAGLEQEGIFHRGDWRGRQATEWTYLLVRSRPQSLTIAFDKSDQVSNSLFAPRLPVVVGNIP